jgi:hypothetical protein
MSEALGWIPAPKKKGQKKIYIYIYIIGAVCITTDISI